MRVHSALRSRADTSFAADVLRPVQDLPLQVRDVDIVEVTSPSVPTPAAARYNARAIEPAPTDEQTRAALSFS